MDDHERHFIGDLLNEPSAADDDVFADALTDGLVKTTVAQPPIGQSSTTPLHWFDGRGLGNEPPPPYSPIDQQQQLWQTQQQVPTHHHQPEFDGTALYGPPVVSPNNAAYLPYQMQPDAYTYNLPLLQQQHSQPPLVYMPNTPPPPAHMLDTHWIAQQQSRPHAQSLSSIDTRQHGDRAQRPRGLFQTIVPPPPTVVAHEQPEQVIITNNERPAPVLMSTTTSSSFAPRTSHASIPVATVLPTATKTYSAVAQTNKKDSPPATAKITNPVRPLQRRKLSSSTTPGGNGDPTADDVTMRYPINEPDDMNLAEAIEQSKMLNDFKKINTKKGKKVPPTLPKARAKTGGGAQTFVAHLVDEDESAGNPSRFHVLADAANRSTTPNPAVQSTDVRYRSNSSTKTRGKTVGGKPTTAALARTATKSSTGGGGASNARNRRANANTAFAKLSHYVGIVLVSVLYHVQLGVLWLRDLFVDCCVSVTHIAWFACRRAALAVTERCAGVCHWMSQRVRQVSAKLLYRQHAGVEADPPTTGLWASVKYIILFKWLRGTASDDGSQEWGAAENIELPTTGEQAMQRLLTCRERDAYSILGVRADCTDDDIRKHYKRQAVLVHPDKNAAAGADEAFKVLAAAFEVIGTPESRRQYNRDNMHKRADLNELHDLMAQLRQKVEEALSTMHCDCGARHRRYVVPKRTVYEARYCGKCTDYHAAKENDIWAESRYMGCLWYYFACIHGQVYDITEWAACAHNPLKHLKANSHGVQYRLMSTRGAAPPPPPSTGNDVEQLLSRLAEAATKHASQQPPHNARTDNDADPMGAAYQPPERNDSRPSRVNNRRRRK